MPEKVGSLLAPYRVLDLTDDRGLLCGKTLADLGADVIKVEPPGGSRARNIGPFFHDTPDPEKSLYWFAFNINKRGITLNIESPDGQEIFKRLVRNADFVVESFSPGYLASLGLGYPELSRVNPSLIMTSLTPFGQNGPYRDYKAPDLIVWAMGGYMYLCGDPDRAPLRISFPLAYVTGSISAAVGSLIALQCRTRTGEGQHVDISIQETVVEIMGHGHYYWEMQKTSPKRMGCLRGGFTVTGAYQRMLWPCQDGYVAYVVLGGPVGAGSNRALVEWMDSESFADDYLRQLQWEELDMGTMRQETFDAIEERLGKFFLAHTKAELYKEALERRVMLFPVATIRDFWESPQLRSREYWEKVEHPELGVTITYPGPFVKTSEFSPSIRRRAPLIGEHNLDIYIKELGFSREELSLLKQCGII